MWWQGTFSGVLSVIAVLVFLLAVKKARHKQFYTDTPILSFLGIYVWGDALILAPFWFLSALVFLFLSPVWILRYTLFFFLMRSAYEVIYWISLQAVKSEYVPPLFRQVKWLGANESAILYQLLHTCMVVMLIVVLLLSFSQF